MQCLGDTTVLAYLGGTLPPERTGAVEHHLAACPECCASVAECANLLDHGDEDTSVQDPPSQARIPLKALGRGQRVGRYEIIEPIGRGGMSVVYRARDPELVRDVAIKIVRPELSLRERPSDSKARLLREARAMARVSHPNVVGIFDVGEWEDQVFVAMELVEGVTLKQYLRQARHPLKTILDLFLAAGQGLVAAHSAELVHRDFKPENVLVGNDGRLRVLDFGLARHVDIVEPVAGIPLRDNAPLTPLTRTGAVAGTPAYMSPEQICGRALDARTDQFSFCVALYEALYGERPFQGESVDELVEQVLQSDVRPAPPGSMVPSSLRATLLRGLAKRPDDRYPTLEGLLEALEGSRSALLAPPSLILDGPLLPPPKAKSTSRSRVPYVAGAAVAGVLVLGAIGWVAGTVGRNRGTVRPDPQVTITGATAVTASAASAPEAAPSNGAVAGAIPPTIELGASSAPSPRVGSSTRPVGNRRGVKPPAPGRPAAPAPLGDKVENPF